MGDTGTGGGAQDAHKTTCAFRRVNDSIRELAGRAPGNESWKFLCECEDVECRELVSLTVGDFDARRSNGTSLPILADCHDDAGQAAVAAG